MADLQASQSAAEAAESMAPSNVRDDDGPPTMPVSAAPRPGVSKLIYNLTWESYDIGEEEYKDSLESAMALYETVHVACGRFIKSLKAEAAFRRQKDDLKYILERHDITTSQVESLYKVIEMTSKCLTEQQVISETSRNQVAALKASYLTKFESASEAFGYVKMCYEELLSYDPILPEGVLKPVEPNLPMVLEVDESDYMD